MITSTARSSSSRWTRCRLDQLRDLYQSAIDQFWDVGTWVKSTLTEEVDLRELRRIGSFLDEQEHDAE